MVKARLCGLCGTTAIAWIAISCPALAQSQPSAQPDIPPPLSNPAAPRPNPGAPNETTVESDSVTQGVAQAPADQSVFAPIIVTAQKRREKIQDVGISITALSGETIKTLNLTNMQQISQQVPNLEVSAWTPAFTTFNLRGISQNNFQDNLEAPIAVYQDEVYVGSMNALGLPIYDLERIEVLRGPQGTLFGRNATGGLIQFVSNLADETYFNGYAEATIADWGTHKLEGAVGGQLAPGIRARIAGVYDKSNGWMKAGFNPFLERKALGRTSQGSNGWALRANVQADLGPDTLLSVIESYSKDNDVPTGQYVVRLAGFDPDTGLGIDPGPPITGSVFKHASDMHTGFDRKVWSTTAKLTHSFSENLDFTYIGNYSKLDKNYIEDAGGGLFFFPFQTIAHHKQWSHEARFSGHTPRMRWQVGAYSLDMDFDGEFTASGAAFNVAPTDEARSQSFTDLSSKNWSIFGQGEYDFTPQLTGILGLRWSKDHKKIKFHTVGFGLVELGPDGQPVLDPEGNPIPIPDGTVIFDFADAIAANPELAGHDKINYGDVAARAQLNYKPHQDLLFYLSYNRGIKGGNWSPAPSVNPFNFRHKPEKLDAYEIGMKSTLARNTRLNLSAFYYNYHDYQAFSLTGLQPQVANSDATVKGGEIELFTRPLRNFDFALSAAFLDSNVDFVPAVFPETGVSDAELPQAPHVSLNALGRYTVPVSFGTLAFQLDGKYASKHFLEGTNSEVSFQRGYAVGNASLSLTSADERWQGSLWVKNFTNSKYKVYNLDLGLLGFVEQMYAAPRQFGATLRFGFKQ
jgi:iron complex outermembrane receptor protein